ncbi:hydroxyisourate hydrolase [Burkholderia guangdongensis]|uniref:hydroxyisourate hydrolase n=1 Tax=Burkholderia guangdongensis TaxID=1792500 RepID=UPI0015CA4F74|nr:hydroxyisourate hydrolase [Burkholderia guangdongensis]
MGKLTTHVLDTANGCPGADIRIELFAVTGDSRRALKTTTTNDDGRCDAPLLEGDALVTGEYELVFHVGNYFATRGVKVPQPRFVDRVVLRFGVSDAAAHYHVPLLVSPWSYSTYRGS